MHLGEVVFAQNNVFGDGVNIASRIESMGIPGSVLISNAIRNQIKNKEEFKFCSLGSYNFKNIGEPIEVFALENAGLSVPQKSKIQGKFEQTSKKPNYMIWAFGIAGLMVLLFFGSSYFTTADPNLQTEQIAEVLDKSIAVLPLINLNNSEDLDYFSDGVTQEIIDELANIGSIKVSAFTTTYQYKNQNKKQVDIAQELGVNYLISGSSRIYEDGQKIKLSIELIDPFNNERIWNRTFEERLDDVPSIQLAVAKQVAENLNIELTISETQQLRNPNTISGEAFRLFLNAKAEINKLSQAGFKNGTAYLEEAIKLDSNYTQAYTLLAWRYAVGASADVTPGVASTSKFIELAEPLIDKAIALDPNSSDIYLVRANSILYSKNKVLDAKMDVEKAFELNSWPRIPINYCICTAVSVYIATNNIEKAREVVNLAKEIDPQHVLYDWDLGNVAMKSGNYEQAQLHFLNSVNKADIPFFKSYLGWSYYYSEDYDEALKYLNKAYENSELASRFNVAALSNTYYKMGNIAEADKYLQELLARTTAGEYNLNLFIADVYLERNDVDKALTFLEKGYEQSDHGFAFYLNLFPRFKELESNPRLQNILVGIQVDGL